MRTLAALALVLGTTLGIPQTVADALRQGSKPLAATDLPESYRAVTLGSNESPGGSFASMYFMGVASDGGGDPRGRLLFSLMNVCFVNPEEFAELLDGKRPRIRAYTM